MTAASSSSAGTGVMPVITGAAEYPDGILEELQGKGVKVDAIDALSLAEEAGSARAANLVLMGRLSRYFDFPAEAWEKSLEAMVPAKFLDLNRKAFALGRATR